MYLVEDNNRNHNSDGIDPTSAILLRQQQQQQQQEDQESMMIIDENMQRCEKILHCKKQIKYWTNLLEELQEEHSYKTTIAKLKLYPKSTWKTLSRKEKLNKDYILATLQSKSRCNSSSTIASGSILFSFNNHSIKSTKCTGYQQRLSYCSQRT